MSAGLQLPPRAGKPRTRGLTAMIDFGVDSFGWTGERGVADLLECAGDYIDFAKIYAANALLIPADPLRRIVRLYREAAVAPFAGGILFEWAHRSDRIADLSPLLHDLGIPGLEISENYIRLEGAERDRWIDYFRERDLDVVYEFGRKRPDEPMTVQKLADIVGAVRERGVEHVIVEQSEIDLAAAEDASVLDVLARQDWFGSVLIEGDPYRYPQQHADLIGRFGPEVNLANVAPGQVLRLEGLRRGVGRAVDYAMFREPEAAR